MTTATHAVPRLVEHSGAYALLLQTAFNQICNPDDWKAPIDALVPWEAANVYMQAVEFMTATTCQCERVKKEGLYYGRLTSIGYRDGPAGP
jgi:hypothetical protein